MNQLDRILDVRRRNYGDFSAVAKRISLILGAIEHDAPDIIMAKPYHREAFHAIAVKIARLVEGNINLADSWLDIAGYATLVHRQIEYEAA